LHDQIQVGAVSKKLLSPERPAKHAGVALKKPVFDLKKFAF